MIGTSKRLTKGSGMRTQVFLTIDTESSIGGAWSDPSRRPLPASHRVFCQNDSGAYGIPLIVEILREYGMCATFFYETLASLVLGESDIARGINYLLEAGQDVQLHVHPTFRHYHDYLQSGDRTTLRAKARLPDLMDMYPEQEQVAFIQEAMTILRRYTGAHPDAFRAGCYAANHSTLRALRHVGIPIDSSYNPAYCSFHSFSERPLATNEVQKIEQTWEFPVTVARTRIGEGAYKPLEISAISSWEMERSLIALHENDVPHVVLMFHSFSAVKARNVYYSAFRPDRIVIHRLRRLVRFLARHHDRFQVTTFHEAAQNLTSLQPTAKSVLPDLGMLHPAMRKLTQGVNRFYWV